MADLTLIKKLLKEIVGANSNLPINAIVKKVTGDTCEVELKGGLVLTDVKLKATIGESDYVILTPKVGSTVTVLSLSGSLDNLTVIKIDQLDKMEYKQAGLNVLVDSTDGKVSIKNNQVSFFDIMKDLGALLKQFKVFTPNGPSGTPLPPTITAITQFETKLNQLLK